MKVTHAEIPNQANKRLVRAHCGALMLSKEHSSTPTCPTCTSVLQGEEAMAAQLLAQWQQQQADPRRN